MAMLITDVFGFLLDGIVLAAVYLFYIVPASFVIWMAVDAAKQDKFFWVIIIIGLPVLGSLVYYFVEKKRDYMTTSAHFGHIHRRRKEDVAETV